MRKVFLEGASPEVVEASPAAKLRAGLVVRRNRTYVFVCNPTSQGIKAQVRLGSLEPGRTLWAVGEERTVSLDGNSTLSDSLGPASAHVYTTRPGG